MRVEIKTAEEIAEMERLAEEAYRNRPLLDWNAALDLAKTAKPGQSISFNGDGKPVLVERFDADEFQRKFLKDPSA